MKEKVLQFINELINTYKYKPLPRDLSEIVRKKYEKYIPNYLKKAKIKLYILLAFFLFVADLKELLLEIMAHISNFLQNKPTQKILLLNRGNNIVLKKDIKKLLNIFGIE